MPKFGFLQFLFDSCLLEQDSAGSGFDDHGGELELHSLDFKDAKRSDSTLLGKARAK